MQLWPDAETEGFVGIGDFHAAMVNPSERLDILNRTIRLRDFGTPGLYHNNSYDRLLVVDPVDGLVHWRDAASLSLADCEWRMHDAPDPNHVYTAVGAPDDDCPDDLEFVGIGTEWPDFKLDVEHTESTSNSIGGIRSIYHGSSTGANLGINSVVDPENGTNIDFGNAVYGEVSKLSDSGTGVTGVVNLDANGGNGDSQVAGVYGTVDASDGYYGFVYGTRGLVNDIGTDIDWAYGAYGRVAGAGSRSASYGLWGESQAEGTVYNNYGGQASATWLTGATVNQSIGLRAKSAPASGITTQVVNSYGLIATGRSGSTGTWGVNATASSSGTGTVNTGVYASGANGATNYGIYATASGPGGSTNWAAYLVGPSFTTANAWTPSDQNLKTNIDLIEDPLSQVMSLRPKRYTYETDAYPQMNLPTGEQYGFLAQEYAEVFPDMVRDVIQPAITDADGELVSEEASFKAMSQANLLPLAIAAIQQQNARIDQLQEQLAACCASAGGQRSNTPVPIASDPANDLRTERLTIAPNPFTTSTTLRYLMAQEGRARLEVSAEDGRSIDVLREERTIAGEHTYEWNTSGLSSGTYFVAFIVDGNTIVKRAVKVNER